MGRPERALDPAAGPVQRFASELREVRRVGGSRPYRDMAVDAGFSIATLSKATAGERLPSLAVVLGYVRACGGDLGEWEARWKEAQAAVAGEARDDEDAEPPYRGLARFEPGDSELFFGRDRLVAELQELVCEHRFAAVFGASGSGKSSLLRAGLIPLMQRKIAERGRPAVLRILTPGDRPVARFGHLLTPGEGDPESWVVVDQFEELFTLCRDEAERARFVELLLAARTPGSRLRVLIAVRADFYVRCAEHRDLADALPKASLLVGPMKAEELREVVTRPAQAAGLLVERELTAKIVDEVLDQPNALPMLSHALLETWRRRRGRMLTLTAYEAAGGLRGAVAATAEEAYGQLDESRRRTARRLLLRMIEPGRGTADTGRPLPPAEQLECADPDTPPIVERLVGARLLSVDEEGVHLAHEALITCWPRLHGWIEEDRELLRHHRALTEAARTWLEHDRDPGTLYRGTRLDRARELFPAHAHDQALTQVEQEFLSAACEVRATERQAAARSSRRARTFTAALSTLLAVALVAGLAAWRQHQDNVRERTDESARRIADVADSLRTTDPRTAMLLGIAAWRVAPLPETRRALLGALVQPEQDALTDPAPGDRPQRFLTDSGRTLLSIDDRTWRTWDVVTHRRKATGRLPDGQVLSVGPDGRLLALAGKRRTRLWDTATGHWTGAALPASEAVNVVVGRHDHLVTNRDSGQIQVRSSTDGRPRFTTRAAPANAALSADGHVVADCPAGRAPLVWDTTRHRTLAGAWEHAGALCDEDGYVTLLFDGTTRLAAVTPTGVLVWDTGSGRQVAELDDHDVRYASLSDDGAFLATADDTQIKVWRLSAPAAPVFRYPLNNANLSGAPVWDSGRHLLRYLEDGTVHSVDLSKALTTAWREQPVDATLLSPDGRTLALADHSGSRHTFRLLDTRDGHVVRTLPTPPLPPPVAALTGPKGPDVLPLMAFSPDGHDFAYGLAVPAMADAPEHFTVWDLRRDRARTVLDLAAPSATDGAPDSLSLGPGARALYVSRITSSENPTSEVWDTARGRRTPLLGEPTGGHWAVRPDGRLLVGDNRVARLPAGPVVAHTLVENGEIGALAFAQDGSLLAAGDSTGRVALWDGDVRRRAGILHNVFPAPLDYVREGVRALALSPDRRTLAVAGDGGELQLWDTSTRQPLGGLLTTPGDPIDTLAFSPDSTTLYAGSDYVPFQRYPVDITRALTRVCARIGDAEVTQAQRDTYGSDIPLGKVCDT
ncbi:WD40 repeat domain-containing protein [Streptomyces griseiscabiei]|uniref:WD40 repeat domain-containing protein n=1 Tax=Streptomyces griseiscabiei TaxID=2993540 RepID=A0ABU4L3E0_9ACTN|nr:WD40 repeat domain-containing protein [Streptomyces griseiscabiei]MBZ3901465.1 hypothetical protein [Streptomyces griseiscabiei]MDX2909985.1 WD40 repeat domain-containing protein [Streptomyces griseiscabiei]